jgi:hypothetical protein
MQCKAEGSIQFTELSTNPSPSWERSDGCSLPRWYSAGPFSTSSAVSLAGSQWLRSCSFLRSGPPRMIRNYCGYCSIPASSANNTTRSNSTSKPSRCSVMLKLKRIVKSYKETGALNEHLGVFGFVDGHTFITKAGDLGMVLQVEGVDYECLDSTKSTISASAWNPPSSCSIPNFVFTNTCLRRTVLLFLILRLRTRLSERPSKTGFSTLPPRPMNSTPSLSIT